MRWRKGFPKIGHYTAMKRRGLLPQQAPRSSPSSSYSSENLKNERRIKGDNNSIYSFTENSPVLTEKEIEEILKNGTDASKAAAIRDFLLQNGFVKKGSYSTSRTRDIISVFEKCATGHKIRISNHPPIADKDVIPTVYPCKISSLDELKNELKQIITDEIVGEKKDKQEAIKNASITLIIFVTILFVLIYFRYLHPYKADHYYNLLRIGISLNEAQKIIPVKIYYRHPYPRPMRRPIVGSEVGWLFSDGSLLMTDFNDKYGLQSFSVDKSRTFAGKTLEVIPGFIMLIVIILFIRKIIR